MTGTPMTQAIDKVVIVGRDVAAWLSANALMRAFGHTGLKVEVVELPSQLRPHDVLMSLPSLEAFHRLLGFNEYEVLKASSGVYSLGQSFANFSRSRPPFFHGYGGHGVAINNLPFFQNWVKARQSGMKVDLEDFSLNAAAAKLGRFFVPTDKTNAFNACNYAYSLKTAPYVQFLKAQALKRGAMVLPARAFDVRMDTESGHVSALSLGDGRDVSGDLFIDATGSEALLLKAKLGVAVESWTQWFPDNRVLVASADRLKSLPSFTQVRALEFGSLHLTPLQDMTGVTHVYHDGIMSDQKALEIAAVVSNMRLGDGATVTPLQVGRSRAAWEKNVVAIGEAACMLHPFDNASLHLIQVGLAHLISLFPVTSDYDLERRQYNENVQTVAERIRDFQVCHGKLNRNVDQPYWDTLRALPAPDSLTYKIELFSARGRLAIFEDEVFELDSWLAIFTGHGLMPEAYDPVADLTADDDAIRQVQGMLGFIREQVQAMNSHDAFIEMYATKSYA